MNRVYDKLMTKLTRKIHSVVIYHIYTMLILNPAEE